MNFSGRLDSLVAVNMDVQHVLVPFCLLSSIITYGLGIFVLAKNSDSPVNRQFFAIMLGASYWAVGEYFIWQSETCDEALFWLKASSFWTLVIVMTIHFILTYTGHPLSSRTNRPVLFLLLYLPGIIFGLVGVFTDYIYVIRCQPDMGFYYTPQEANPVYSVETLYFLLIMIWGVYLGIRSWHYASLEKNRTHYYFISIGFLLILGLGSLSAVILPFHKIFIPNVVFIGILGFSVIISYAILRYNLFTLSPESAASNIIRTMPDGLILVDRDGFINTINSSGERLLQKSKKKICGQRIGSILPEYVYKEIEDQISIAEQVSDLEAILDESGSPVVSISGSVVYDPTGNPAGIILIIRDITSRKAAEKSLHIANEKINLLNRLTRHDISNLVTPLHGYLSIIREDGAAKPVDPRIITCLDLVEKIASHLKFSHQYHEIGLHHPEWQSLEAMIDLAISSLSHEKVEIIVEVAPVMILADPLFQKVIYNLLENAIRHGEMISWIRISTEVRDADLIIMVLDDGAGIRETDKELIFMQGYGKNSGLGLTLSREILSMTGIAITESGEFEKGACFEIIVPSSVWRSIIPS